MLRTLGPANLGLAIEIARVPEMIRGYGHVKQRHLEAARPKWDALMADWRAGPLRIGAQPGTVAHRTDRVAGRAGHAAADAGVRFAHRALGGPSAGPGCPLGRLASPRPLG